MNLILRIIQNYYKMTLQQGKLNQMRHDILSTGYYAQTDKVQTDKVKNKKTHLPKYAQQMYTGNNLHNNHMNTITTWIKL